MPIDPKKRQQIKKKRPQLDPADMVDLHLRFGLEDQFLRVPKKDWGLLIENWIVAGEDVILRCSYKAHEVNIVLRGTSDAILDIQPCNPEKNLPVFNCFSVMEMRRKNLSEHGVE